MGGRPYSFAINREPFEFMRTARSMVVDYVNHRRPSDSQLLTDEDVNILWFSTHGCVWQVVLGTATGDGVTYYSISHNDEVTRLDVFKTFDTQIISNKDNE